MTDINNVNDLAAIAEQMMREALEDIQEEVIGIFQRDYLQRLVYDSHGSNAIYYNGSGKPTNQFKESWEWSEIKKSIDTLSTEMFYNPSNMDFDQDTYLHGSKYSRPNDIRDNLMDILNKSGRSSSLWLSVSRPQAYWNAFIEDMFGGKLESIITKHFTNKGFVRI